MKIEMKDDEMVIKFNENIRLHFICVLKFSRIYSVRFLLV